MALKGRVCKDVGGWSSGRGVAHAPGCAFKEECAARLDASASLSYVCLAVLVLGRRN